MSLWNNNTHQGQVIEVSRDPEELVREFPADKVATDAINPGHYVKRGIEVRHVIRAFECTYHCGDAIAYILRAKFKNNYAEDLRKAIAHLQFELEEVEKK